MTDFYRAIEIQALAAVEARSAEWFLRHVSRWYSKTFSTPLADVMELTEEFLFTQYFENRYEDLVFSEDELDIQKLAEMRHLLLETKEERFERELKESIGKTDNEVAAQQDEEMAKIAWDAKKAKDAKDASQKGKTLKSLEIPKISKPMMEPGLSREIKLKENVDFKFLTEEAFEEELSRIEHLGNKK